MPTSSHKFEHGVRVRNKVTGQIGIITACTVWVNGCVRYVIEPPMDKDGKVPDSVSVDEQLLEVVDGGINVKKAKTGGGGYKHPTPTGR